MRGSMVELNWMNYDWIRNEIYVGELFVGACDVIAIWRNKYVVVVVAEDTSFGDVSEDSLKGNDCSSKMT